MDKDNYNLLFSFVSSNVGERFRKFVNWIVCLIIVQYTYFCVIIPYTGPQRF